MRLGLRRLALLLCFIPFAQTLTARTVDFSGGSVIIKRIGTEQGLSNRLVRSITQDSRGFIWFGADGGLNRYDGDKCIVFRSGNDSTTLRGSSVWVLCSDRDGIVWAGTALGLNRFDPVTKTFERYFHDARDPSSLSHDNIRSIFIDRQEVLWVGTVQGLNKFIRKTKTWTRYYANPNDTTRPGENFVNTILEDRNGTLWIAAGGDELVAGGGLFTMDRNTGTFTLVGPRMKTYACYEDRSGEFWVSVEGPGLCKVDRATGKFIPVPLPPKDPGNPLLQGIKAFCEDRSGDLWMATKGWTLLRYDKRTNTFTRYSYDPRNSGTISSSGLNTIYADNNGLVWVGTDRGGVNTVSTKPFQYLHSLGSIQLRSRVDVVFEDRDGILWIGSQGNGVWRYNIATGNATCVLPKGLIRKIVQDNDGIIWIADRFSVVRYDPRSSASKVVWEMPTVRGVRDRLVTMMIDRERNLWLGGNSSLFRVGKDMKEYRVFVHDPHDPRSITAEQIMSIAEDRLGNIWVSTYTGVSIFDKKTQAFTRLLHDERDTSSLSSTSFPSMHIDRFGTLWIGTSNGLNRFNEVSSSFSKFFFGDSRATRNVNGIQEDEKGRFWYRSNNMIMEFDPATGKFTSFDQSEGLEDVEVLNWSRTRLRSGQIIFGTIDGILVFHPDSLRTSAFVPPIVITGIKKLNRQLRLSTSSEFLREISFEHEENVFSISYAALSYDMPEFNQYAYKLEGFDKDWVQAGNRREAMYTNLDPGEYTFRVKGSNHDGVWNETGASLLITVQPAYWQAWWFKLILGMAIVGLAGFVYRRETHRLKKEKLIQQEFSRQQIESQEAERKRLAAELHDGLGQDLLVVSNELQQFLQEGNGSKEDLRQAANLVQESIQSVREISSNLHPHHLDRLGFCAAVEAMTENLARSTGLIIQRSCDDVDRLLSKETEMHVYRIIQEALSNIVRHASAKNVNVQVKKNLESIEISVSDDGRGFNVNDALERRPSRPSGERLHGFGLSSMTERVRIVGGTMKIESSPGSGTTVHVSLPYS